MQPVAVHSISTWMLSGDHDGPGSQIVIRSGYFLLFVHFCVIKSLWRRLLYTLNLILSDVQVQLSESWADSLDKLT